MSNQPINILFIGNSYTQNNNLPSIVQELAKAAGFNLNSHLHASGGATLASHANNPKTIDLLTKERWDAVVLQEQSIIPAVEAERPQMYQAIRYLDWYIKKQGARTLLFMTWGRKNGLPDFGFEDFESMQEHLEIGYRAIANEVEAILVPAGLAWQQAVKSGIDNDLWSSDGSHSTQAGTYLAACVFYYVLFGNTDDKPIPYFASLSEKQALQLQQIAFQTAFY